VSLDFSVTYSFRPYYGPGVDSAPSENEYQEHFLGGKGGRCVRLTNSPPSCVECHGNLGAQTSWNTLGHTGPVTGSLYLLPYTEHSRVNCQHQLVNTVLGNVFFFLRIVRNTHVHLKVKTESF